MRQTSVRVAKRAIEEVEDRIGRQLMEQEMYAVAKLTLFRAFDSEHPGAAVLVPVAEDMFDFLTTLGRN
jgi:hypothetical protein